MSDFVLHLLRHGATAAEGQLIGRTDAVPLAAGVAACAARATGLEIARLVCSDRARSRAAATHIAALHGLSFREDPRWRECDFGAWDGLAFDAIDSAALAAFQTDPANHPPPGGESWPALVARVTAAIEEMDAPTLVVTHGGAMRAALAGLCGFAFPRLWNIALPHAALLSLRVWPGTPYTAQIIGLAT